MARGQGVLVDGPLEGRRVLVHLFARGLPMRHLLVFERAPRGPGEWVRWRLWNEPPQAASYRYRVHHDDETSQPRYEQRQIRYVFDPAGLTTPQLPTEVVFAPLRNDRPHQQA